MTVVPAVTAERSPPDSRRTGADSPVMTDSSTMAAPATISPSAGIASWAGTSTSSPLRKSSEGTVSVVPSERRRRPKAFLRPRRRASACALPRPSASASAKLAKRTVNHNHRQIWITKASASPWDLARKISQVVTTAPISVTNMTGFFTMWRGSSLAKLARMAGKRISGSKTERFLVVLMISPRQLRKSEGQVRRGHQEVLDNRAHRERREEGQGADDDDRAGKQDDERQSGHREAASIGGCR